MKCRPHARSVLAYPALQRSGRNKPLDREKTLSGEIPSKAKMTIRMPGQLRRIGVAEVAVEKALYPGAPTCIESELYTIEAKAGAPSSPIKPE